MDLIPTHPLEQSDNDHIKKVLDQNLYFFDGRSARHLGAFSETYTPDYRLATMGDADFSLNGLGGEIFRDSYFMGKRIMSWNEWAKRFLFFPFSAEALGSEKSLNNISEALKHKLEQELSCDFNHADIFKTHAYYGLVKMPQANGSVAQAYGKISHFLFPFIELRIIEEALKAVPYLGVGGTYQAKLITKLSPELAKVGSHYGIRFDKVSTKYLIWSKLKSLGTGSFRNSLVREKLLKRRDTEKQQRFLLKTNEYPVFRQAREALMAYSPNTQFDLLMLDNTQRRYAIFLGHMLNKLSPYIE